MCSPSSSKPSPYWCLFFWSHSVKLLTLSTAGTTDSLRTLTKRTSLCASHSLMVAASSLVMHLKIGYESGFPGLAIPVVFFSLFRSLRAFAPCLVIFIPRNPSLPLKPGFRYTFFHPLVPVLCPGPITPTAPTRGTYAISWFFSSDTKQNTSPFFAHRLPFQWFHFYFKKIGLSSLVFFFEDWANLNFASSVS